MWKKMEMIFYNLVRGKLTVQISDVRVRKAGNSAEGKLKAICSVVFDGMFVVHEMRVVEGVNGLFVAMPRRKTAEGEYKDLAHPITAEARETIQKSVLEAYLELESREAAVV
jgi:stage V sporulation protein G